MIWASGLTSLVPPLPHQLVDEIPRESGYAGPEEPTQPPSSHTATRLHAAYSAGVTTGPGGGAAGAVVVVVEVAGVDGAVVVVVGAVGKTAAGAGCVPRKFGEMCATLVALGNAVFVVALPAWLIRP